MKTAIVTGATSFIGLRLIKKLIAEHWKVYAVVRKYSDKVMQLPHHDLIEIVYLNMHDYEQLSDLITEPCDVYISLAWNGTRGDARMNGKQQKENYLHSMSALKAAIKIGCQTIINAGSQAEYGSMNAKITEDAICCPNTEYGLWKLKYYEEGMKYCKKYNISFKEARFFSLYGEDDNGQTMILSILHNMINNYPCKLTHCIQLWDFLYIDDAIDGIWRLMTLPCEDGAYNFGSGDIRPLKEFVMEMYKITNSKSQLLFGAIPYPQTGMVNVCPDISKLQTQTGWKAKIDFLQGIHKIINDKKFNEDHT